MFPVPTAFHTSALTKSAAATSIRYDTFIPYGKALVGRGVFNFAALNASGQAAQIANLAYNTVSFGGGLEVRFLPGLNVRVIDYEYQRWSNFPPISLDPQVLSVGVAYHFRGAKGLTH